MEFPRYVHGPDGEHKQVNNETQYDEALAGGVYRPSPYLTPEQDAAVLAAKIAAGEVEPEPVEGKKGKKGEK